MDRYIFTSESVSPGHPDKVCDQISDALLDYCLGKDPHARCAFECFATKDNIIVGGETRLKDGVLSELEVVEIVRNVIKKIGYDDEGFSWQNTPVKVLIHGQSQDIAIGVDANQEKEEGAGDQGIMFGYACTETETFMPAAIYYSHKLLEAIWTQLKNGGLEGLGPDAKTQISLNYENGVPISADSVTLSIQHKEAISLDFVKQMVMPIIESVLPRGWMPKADKIFINPTGRFVIGGPVSDAGLTGRKIIVDTYGGAAPHGGGAFSGKDPTKVEAYVSRYVQL
jgi:S-adenosylmethionine synthetase